MTTKPLLIHSDRRILVVDDEAPNVLLLEKILKHAGYTRVTSTRDPRDVAALLTSFAPDIILLDLHMPHLDGYSVLEQVRASLPPGTFLPIIVLTADVTMQARERALSSGASDFLTKPFDPLEVLLRIKNLLETRSLYLQLREQNSQLELKVLDRTRDLEQATYEIVHRLARAAEFRDDETGKHTVRVGDIAARLGQVLGIPVHEVDILRRAAPLHDVGKIGISDLILLKPGKLTAQEFDTMKTHVSIGAHILSGSQFPLLQMAEQIARFHHERWDGTGYLVGTSAAAIPLPARIVAVVDVFDALTHERPYKKAWPIDQALEEIRRSSGTHFDPAVVEAFLSFSSDLAPANADDVLALEL